MPQAANDHFGFSLCEIAFQNDHLADGRLDDRRRNEPAVDKNAELLVEMGTRPSAEQLCTGRRRVNQHGVFGGQTLPFLDANRSQVEVPEIDDSFSWLIVE